MEIFTPIIRDDIMSWEQTIKKEDAKFPNTKAELRRAMNILSKLRKEYNIKLEHIDGLYELLFELETKAHKGELK